MADVGQRELEFGRPERLSRRTRRRHKQVVRFEAFSEGMGHQRPQAVAEVRDATAISVRLDQWYEGVHQGVQPAERFLQQSPAVPGELDRRHLDAEGRAGSEPGAERRGGATGVREAEQDCRQGGVGPPGQHHRVVIKYQPGTRS